MLLAGNWQFASTTPHFTLAQSFWVGFRFDLAVSAYLLIPLLVVLFLWRGPKRYWPVLIFCVLAGAIIFGGIAEIEFYREFESRFNALVFEYLSHPKIVAGMIWAGYPVLRYSLLWLAVTVFFLILVAALYRRYIKRPDAPDRQRRGIAETAWAVCALALLVFAARGGFTGEPLRWGDAFFSNSTFANHLALNGTFTLGRSAWDKIYGKQKSWVRSMPEEAAVAEVRRMLFLPNEIDLSREGYPLLRSEAPPFAPRLPKTTVSQAPVNVVLILQESLSSRFVGALGAPYGVTPDFDRLAEQGVLFERAFSNGTHTHQGVFASLTSFPNLPGYEYLMKMMEANQDFSSLPGFLQQRGYQTVFLYNGLFSWDNKEGFFRQHGISRFIGSKDYENPTFIDPVWGVSDYDVYMRANQEFKRMARQGPFFAVILTLTNHSPFNLPDPLPFEPFSGKKSGRLNGLRYADWAMGEFFKKAADEAYFSNTLFVITGDHGFSTAPMVTPMLLSRFSVPLLFYSPSLLGTEPRRFETVASQVDIVPSVLGLLGDDTPHQCWGRNLFAVSQGDPGFAVIKPSGGEDEAAIIEGDHILIKYPDKRSELYRFSLQIPFDVSPDVYLEEPERAADLENRLRAYVQTGILLLRRRSVGTPQ
jgi:phosphoglycerol transferase MdoB-like AlkP superfamily enzyme